MSDLENKKTEETPKKRPYNLREKKEKKAAYRSLIRPELADELYDKILNIIVVQKKYKDPDYSAKDLAKELKAADREARARLIIRWVPVITGLLCLLVIGGGVLWYQMFAR